jgi:hypothetical protein
VKIAPNMDSPCKTGRNSKGGTLRHARCLSHREHREHRETSS